LFWHITPLFNPANYSGSTENVFPGVHSMNLICVPREARFGFQLREIKDPNDRWDAG
jgi:hypothetical protein